MPKKTTSHFPPSVDYKESLLNRLKDHDYAAAYLNTALEEAAKGDLESHQLFLRALRNVAQAQGSLSNLAKKAHVRRESLYRMLSENGNPELSSLVAVLHSMGFSLGIR